MDKNILELIDQIDKTYENPKCELEFGSTYQLLVAVILSAQCTDKRVNMVTRELFKDYGTPSKMITLSQEELEQKIHSCGFFRNKAKSILACSNDLVSHYGGEVPSDKDKLKALAGVGEKTANVVLSLAFKVPAIAVDTHVFRVSNRLGLACHNNVTLTQKDLENNIPKEKWIKFHYALVLHGRYVCKAIRPKCDECAFSKNCKYFQENMKK